METLSLVLAPSKKMELSVLSEFLPCSRLPCHLVTLGLGSIAIAAAQCGRGRACHVLVQLSHRVLSGGIPEHTHARISLGDERRKKEIPCRQFWGWGIEQDLSPSFGG